MLGFLTPYRGERYHLRDYEGQKRPPRGPNELFNHMHSSLQNVIERSFGVLKAHFTILKKMSNYRLHMQRLIPIVYCVLHNFIRSQARGDRMFMEYDNEDMLFDDEGEDRAIPNIDLNPSNVELMSNVRDEITRKMCSCKLKGVLSYACFIKEVLIVGASCQEFASHYYMRFVAV
ncbi:hypothetical protein Ddye_014842 [Dipteronia dyeriana]|uniref:DDE Tnp4 domain-containing protein n=1 Tax=Dipteronia dyeriana TaxID=168575 RepID=A0AAD9U4F0_9ROSI|nr:hypothetical protein Ddye_014842 [Dipteronia dyeriana]